MKQEVSEPHSYLGISKNLGALSRSPFNEYQNVLGSKDPPLGCC